MKRLLLIFFATLIFINPALAHDKEAHKGPKIEGKLLSLQGNKAEVQTASRKVTVLLSAETKYELGAEGKPSTKTELKPGSDVMVHGHKLETGEFGATEIMINAAASGGHHDDDDGEDEPHEHSK